MSEELLITLNRIQDRSVQFVRLAGNSLIVYLECEPGNLEQGYSIWLEPTWHFRDKERVLTGSREAQTEDDSERSRISELFKALYKKKIIKIDIEFITNDLKIEFEDGYYLITFVSDPHDEESWLIRDLYKDIKIIGNPKTIQVLKD